MAYGRLRHALDPLPILILRVSVSKPCSPAASTGFTLVQLADESLRILILVAMLFCSAPIQGYVRAFQVLAAGVQTIYAWLGLL